MISGTNHLDVQKNCDIHWGIYFIAIILELKDLIEGGKHFKKVCPVVESHHPSHQCICSVFHPVGSAPDQYWTSIDPIYISPQQLTAFHRGTQSDSSDQYQWRAYFV